MELSPGQRSTLTGTADPTVLIVSLASALEHETRTETNFTAIEALHSGTLDRAAWWNQSLEAPPTTTTTAPLPRLTREAVIEELTPLAQELAQMWLNEATDYEEISRSLRIAARELRSSHRSPHHGSRGSKSSASWPTRVCNVLVMGGTPKGT